MCHFFPVHHLGIAFLGRVEGQNITISLIAWLEFELAYYNVVIQHINYYATWVPLVNDDDSSDPKLWLGQWSPYNASFAGGTAAVVFAVEFIKLGLVWLQDTKASMKNRTHSSVLIIYNISLLTVTVIVVVNGLGDSSSDTERGSLLFENIFLYILYL